MTTLLANSEDKLSHPVHKAGNRHLCNGVVELTRETWSTSTALAHEFGAIRQVGHVTLLKHLAHPDKTTFFNASALDWLSVTVIHVHDALVAKAS